MFNCVAIKHKQMSFVSNGGKFKHYTVLDGLIFPTPTQPRISFERAIYCVIRIKSGTFFDEQFVCIARRSEAWPSHCNNCVINREIICLKEAVFLNCFEILVIHLYFTHKHCFSINCIGEDFSRKFVSVNK
jgi:hypothetical protein